MWNPATPELVRLPMTMFWSSVQLGVATLCACMPTYAALFKTAHRKITRSYPARTHSPLLDSSKTLRPSQYYRMGDGSSTAHQTESSVRISSPSYEMDKMAPGAIYVNRRVDVHVK
jgi:hypothetical protein